MSGGSVLLFYGRVSATLSAGRNLETRRSAGRAGPGESQRNKNADVSPIYP